MLSAIVLSRIASEPWFTMPPPLLARLSTIVLFSIVSEPQLVTPPPSPKVKQSTILQSLIVRASKRLLLTPPVCADGPPPEMVRPEREAVVEPEMYPARPKIEPTGLLASLTVRTFAPGPWITSGPDGSLRLKELVRLMVCGEEELKTAGSNVIRVPARLVSLLAWLIT